MFCQPVWLNALTTRAPVSLRWTLSPPESVPARSSRSEEHTSELQSQSNLVCRLLLEKKRLESLAAPISGQPETRGEPTRARRVNQPAIQISPTAAVSDPGSAGRRPSGVTMLAQAPP